MERRGRFGKLQKSSGQGIWLSRVWMREADTQMSRGDGGGKETE